jgi:hypothetical protein
MTKYAAYDYVSIYAVAETPEAAIAKARHDAQEPEAQFSTAKVSDELAEQIERDGWYGNSRSFDIQNGFIVDTTDR